MTPERIREIRAALDSGLDRVQVAAVDADELRELLDLAEQALGPLAGLRRRIETCIRNDEATAAGQDCAECLRGILGRRTR